MWKEIRKNDLQSSYLHDRICTQNDLPCVQIFKETRHKYLLRWDYNTFNDRGWERAKFLDENHFWRILHSAFRSCNPPKKAMFFGNVLSGAIHGLSLESARATADRIYLILNWALHPENEFNPGLPS
jgi:hypothetical protein